MEELRSMLLAAAALVLIEGTVELLLRDGPVRVFARFACGLLLMLALIKPLSGLLSAEPDRLPESARGAMAEAEPIILDEALVLRRIQEAAESAGARVRVEAVSYASGAIDRVELYVQEGDPAKAKYALCLALGLNEEQVVIR